MLIENSGVGDTSVVSPLQCFMPGSGLGVRVGGDLAAMWMFTGAQRMTCIRNRTRTCYESAGLVMTWKPLRIRDPA